MNLWETVNRYAEGAEIFREWVGSGGTVVDRELAQERAEICLKCPNNQHGGVLPAVVAEAIKKHIELKNQIGLRVMGEKQLHQCQACLCALRLKVWCPIKHINNHIEKKELETYPAQCWMRTEQIHE